MTHSQIPKIEKGVPMPSKCERHGGKKETFAKMEIGDSFVVDTYAESQSWRGVARYSGGQMKSHKIEDGKYRMWRIK